MAINQLTARAQVDEILEQERAIIFKHSTSCPISSFAHSQVEKYVKQHPDSSVYKVHVIEDRDVSNYIARETAIEHASPQLIFLEEGDVKWSSSHFGITAKKIARNTGNSA